MKLFAFILAVLASPFVSAEQSDFNTKIIVVTPNELRAIKQLDPSSNQPFTSAVLKKLTEQGRVITLDSMAADNCGGGMCDVKL